LALIAQAVFLLESGQTDRQTDVTERPTHSGGYTVGVDNDDDDDDDEGDNFGLLLQVDH